MSAVVSKLVLQNFKFVVSLMSNVITSTPLFTSFLGHVKKWGTADPTVRSLSHCLRNKQIKRDSVKIKQ